MVFHRLSWIVVAGLVATLLAFQNPHLDSKPRLASPQKEMANGWSLNPVGSHTPIADMPTLGAVSPNGRWIFVGTTGYGAHQVHAFAAHPKNPEGPGPDVTLDGRPRFTLTLPKMWGSLRAATDFRLVVSGAAQGVIWQLKFEPETAGLQLEKSIPVKGEGSRKPWIGSVEALADGSLLALDRSGVRTDSDYLVHLAPDGTEIARVKLPSESLATCLSPNQEFVYVTEHALHQVLEINVKTHTITRQWTVGRQPNALLAHGDDLFVSESGSDTVSILDLKAGEISRTVRTAMSPKAPLGSIPNGLALSADGTTLFVSCGGNNAVAVVGLEGESPRVKGFIPTGRYPTMVLVGPSDRWVYVGVGKGLGTRANYPPEGSGVEVRKNQPGVTRSFTYDYILSTVRGALTRVPFPKDSVLTGYTRRAVEASPYRDELLAGVVRPKGSVLPGDPKQPSPFKHILYIIKENRTYDQVFGDMPKGNGDPSLCIFGDRITPNHHKIAKEFVLLDNVYCDGEVSQDGWEWSTAALDSDWSLKDTYLAYGGKGGAPNDRHTIRPMSGYLWEWAGAYGKTYFSYGAKTFGGLFSPTWKGNFSEAWNQTRQQGVPDYKKVDVFIGALAEAERTGKWPNLILMSLTDDHTSGTRPGSPTPSASVASNDLALGKVVEAVTKSRFWPETAIFVIEDDAQDGPDHVDAHRTVALVVSPYTKRGSYDPAKYTTTSMVRSIELALGIPPQTQYDTAARPMFGCFTGKKNLAPYKSVVPEVDLGEINKATAPFAALSQSLDFSDVDLADFATLNRILWASMKPGKAYPSPRASFR